MLKAEGVTNDSKDKLKILSTWRFGIINTCPLLTGNLSYTTLQNLFSKIKFSLQFFP